MATYAIGFLVAAHAGAQIAASGAAVVAGPRLCSALGHKPRRMKLSGPTWLFSEIASGAHGDTGTSVAIEAEALRLVATATLGPVSSRIDAVLVGIIGGMNTDRPSMSGMASGTLGVPMAGGTQGG